jgi:hypothetical protein
VERASRSAPIRLSKASQLSSTSIQPLQLLTRIEYHRILQTLRRRPARAGFVTGHSRTAIPGPPLWRRLRHSGSRGTWVRSAPSGSLQCRLGAVSACWMPFAHAWPPRAGQIASTNYRVQATTAVTVMGCPFKLNVLVVVEVRSRSDENVLTGPTYTTVLPSLIVS